MLRITAFLPRVLGAALILTAGGAHATPRTTQVRSDRAAQDPDLRRQWFSHAVGDILSGAVQPARQGDVSTGRSSSR